jgi:heme/copper-type cytochrome/quinol oxidase subunit 1
MPRRSHDTHADKPSPKLHLMLIFGGFGGIVNASYAMNAMIHNTAWVPGHFHLIFAGTTVIMYFAIAKQTS